MGSEPSCKFCQIASRALSSAIVFEDSISLAFLDNRPLFPGHTLLIPKQHFEALEDLPADLIGAFFENVQRLARAVESGMNAEGSFVAINNRVSQSVPHLHIHIVPRSKKDGLRGFFWPRRKYESADEMERVRAGVRGAIAKISSPGTPA